MCFINVFEDMVKLLFNLLDIVLTPWSTLIAFVIIIFGSDNNAFIYPLLIPDFFEIVGVFFWHDFWEVQKQLYSFGKGWIIG